MSLLTHLCYCIKLDIPKPIEHTQVIYTDNIKFVCDDMAVTCIGKKLLSAEGNILSTQNNVIQPMNNHFQFSANKIMLYVYINMLPCKCSVCCQILCHIPILTC